MSSSLPNSSEKNKDNIKGLNDLFKLLPKKEENENEEENCGLFEEFEKFVDMKLTKYPLKLEKKDSKIIEKIIQMDKGYFIVLEKEIIEKKESKQITSEQMKILKTVKTNQKEVVSQNIENELIVTTLETKYKIVIKDKFYNEIYSVKTEDINPSFFEIKENGANYAIICENNNLHKKLLNKPYIESRPYDIKMKIFVILQISDVKYIISCDKGVYYYEELIFNLNPNQLKEQISKHCFKKGVILGSKISIFLDNENQQGCIYKILFNTRINIQKEKTFKYPFILETFTVFNCEENNITHKIVLCAYKINPNNYGIALIRERQNKIEIYEIEFNFIIKCICPLKNIIKDNNNILSGNNTKIVDSNYIIIVGENNDEVEMGIYKIKYLDNYYPNIKLITYLSCDKIATNNLEEINFVAQSYQKGNLIVEYYNKEADVLYFEEND